MNDIQSQTKPSLEERRAVALERQAEALERLAKSASWGNEWRLFMVVGIMLIALQLHY